MEIRNDPTIRFARMQRRTAGVSALRQWRKADSFGAQIYDRTSRKGLQKESGRQSEQARAKAKGQAFRFPRPCRLARSGFLRFAGQLRICQPFSDDVSDADVKTLSISHLPIVVAEGLFIEIPEQMERLDRNVGSADASLE